MSDAPIDAIPDTLKDRPTPPFASGFPTVAALRRLTASDAFHAIEHVIYIVLAALLSVVAVAALGRACLDVWNGVLNMHDMNTVFPLVDTILFVLMLAEILHTVQASIRSGTLTAEPFLMVGLIASIRRILVITLDSSRAPTGPESVAANEIAFRHAMIEFGLLGFVIIAMVVSIYMMRRSRSYVPDPDA
jgi:uncharacterized membrane protein (DUF373 family)